MDDEKMFKEFGRYCNKTRKPNLFKRIKAKSGKTKGGDIYVKLFLVGFDNEEASEKFAKLIVPLLYESSGYNTDWEKWSFCANAQTKTIKIVPTDFWKKYHVFCNFVNSFIKFPDNIGFHYNDNMELVYDGDFVEAISLLTNLKLDRIYE